MNYSLFVFFSGIWSICLLFRLFISKPPWTFREILQHDLRLVFHAILFVMELFVTVVYTMLIFLSVFFEHEGFVAFIAMMGLLHYIAPWELVNTYLAPGYNRLVGYFLGPGPDELWIGRVLQHWASNPKTLVVLMVGIVLMLLPKQSLRRDRIIRRLYEGGFFPTYYDCFLFVKYVSWMFILGCILYISYV